MAHDPKACKLCEWKRQSRSFSDWLKDYRMSRMLIFKSGGRYIIPPKETRLDMQRTIFSHTCNIYIETMRKQRRQKQIAKHFDAPFIEDVAEPYIGYKILNITLDGVLQSAYNQQIWPISGLEAECPVQGYLDRGHNPRYIPHPDCTCGIYALKDIPRKINDLYSSVVVQVALGGYVIRASNGYRASIAKVTKVLYEYGKGETSIQMFVANKYGVPLQSYNYGYNRIYKRG